MSLFLDVWTLKGFILVSDVRLTSNGEQSYIHKLRACRPGAKVTCAIAVCGDYPKACINFFDKAIATKDTLRDVAYSFASAWTERFAETRDYSAVHLVGFEHIPNTDEFVPQMWYWHNSSPGEDFYSEDRLKGELNSFSDFIPFNNHLPLVAQERAGKVALNSLSEERLFVLDFLGKYQPVFTWNGDNDFWPSVSKAVESAMNLLREQTSRLGLRDTAQLARACLRFVADVGELLLNSTVGVTTEKKCDVLIVTPHEVECVEWAEWPDSK